MGRPLCRDRQGILSYREVGQSGQASPFLWFQSGLLSGETRWRKRWLEPRCRHHRGLTAASRCCLWCQAGSMWWFPHQSSPGGPDQYYLCAIASSDSNRRFPSSVWSLYNCERPDSVAVTFRFPKEFAPKLLKSIVGSYGFGQPRCEEA